MVISEQIRKRFPRPAKAMYRGLVNVAVGLQGGRRQLPGFLVIGAQKSATTTLSMALRSHPQIRAAFFKEVHYFDLNFDKGSGWYERHFPRYTGEGNLTFETTPYYLFHPQVPERVHEFDPKIKLIVILRDPVERAYSHFHMERTRGHESLETFEEAIEAEDQRIAEDLSKVVGGTLNTSDAVQRFSYISRGYYVEQLARWLKVFSRDSLHVIDYKIFQKDPSSVLSQVAQFLSVTDDFTIPANRMMSGGDYRPIQQALREKLQLHFQEKNEGLEKLLGIEFSWLR